MNSPSVVRTVSTPILIATAALLLSAATAVSASTDESNWTFTYLKASPGNERLLRTFIEVNWFAMDAIAVERGLFKRYRLIENLAMRDAAEHSDWDYIVAVEYFGDQTYADVRDRFEKIRAQHETVRVEGKTLRELGRVIRSERVVIY